MNTVNLTMAIVLGGLYATGFYLLLQRSLMRVLLGIVILGHGANLLLQLAGGSQAGRPPMLGDTPIGRMADPLPQAMALTAIVITFALTTFLLALAYRAWQLLGHDEVQDDVEDRRIRRLEAELAEADEDTERELDSEATR
ncbi:multicomponent Na+:H+ antiporter subunit C [Actinopolyspora mzabensis]|uniref:Multicomponent Na+:H+ antiporter subunit C n=1 Tax=Actinopolyspora mzabensis TaxID=995066 RepID=A0A1G9CXC0_ACTMZ|nr:Na(+)/H(+) antiporter subunit C [Actinopolyspora mzabensis]SDK56273.1 multicomponent Na+:H+ antiporter subunit C [Actinopolyspora mzabensis]